MKAVAKPAPERILRAAFREFERRGFAGTRVESIARRARVIKQLLYYYFGNKQKLYEQVASTIHKEREVSIHDAPDVLADNLEYWLKQPASDPDYLRFLMWERLEVTRSNIPGEMSRLHFWQESLRQAVADQGKGLWPRMGPDASQTLLSRLGLVMFPLAFPHWVKLMAKQDTTDPEFLAQRAEHLRVVAELLTASGARKR
ncbi:MAG: TetR/AcrR family transcriptional regulator [Candidatus Synoicihabitans palmerolidicus]|nr:TetR/AcrR family transcriptional regulator [Candidatus Synoicihabitans palmerolidicus]